MKKILFAIILSFSFINLTAALDTYGEIASSVIGEDCYQGYSNIIETSDGNILTVGQYASAEFDLPHAGLSDALIVKYDKEGNIIWKKSYSTELIDFYTSVVELDGYYYAAGWVTRDNASYTAQTNLLVVKYDEDGNQIWAEDYYLRGGDTIQAIATDGTNIALVGYTSNGQANSSYNGFISTVDTDGNLIETIYSNVALMYTSIIYDGENYIVGGGYSLRNDKATVTKYTSSLELIAEEELVYNGAVTKILNTDDSYYAVGDAYDGSFVIKYSKEEKIIVNQAKISNEGTLALTSFIEAGDNFYAIGYINNGEFTDFSLNNVQKYDYLVLEYDKELNLVNKNNFGTESDDVAFNAVYTDETLYFAGYTSHDNECDLNTICPSGWSGNKYEAATNSMNVSESTGISATLRVYKNYKINTKTEGKGTITISQDKASANTEITFEVTPEKGYKIEKILVTDADGKVVTFTNNKFTMPSSNVTIEAIFIKDETNPDTTDVAVISCIIIIVLGLIGTIYSIRKLIWLK